MWYMYVLVISNARIHVKLKMKLKWFNVKNCVVWKLSRLFHRNVAIFNANFALTLRETQLPVYWDLRGKQAKWDMWFKCHHPTAPLLHVIDPCFRKLLWMKCTCIDLQQQTTESNGIAKPNRILSFIINNQLVS